MNYLLIIILQVGAPITTEYASVEEVCKAFFATSEKAEVFEKIPNPSDLNKDIYVSRICKDPEVVQPPTPPPYTKYEFE